MALIDDIYYGFVVTGHRDSFVLPGATPHMTGYGDGENLLQSGELLLGKFRGPATREPLALEKKKKLTDGAASVKNWMMSEEYTTSS